MALVNFDTALMPEYQKNVIMLAQQNGSKLRGMVRTDFIKAERNYFTRYDGATIDVITDRLKDATLSDTTFSRIAVDMVSYGGATGIDAFELNKTSIADPMNPVTMAQSMAMGRYIDRIILAAAGATAIAGKAGAGTEALALTVADSEVGGMAYPTGAQGLQVGKIIQAYKLLADRGATDGNLVLAITPLMARQLMATNEVANKLYGISEDQATALRTGRIATIAGFKVVVIQPSDSNGNIVPTNGLTAGSLRRYAYAFDTSGMGLSVAEDLSEAYVALDDRKFRAPIAYTKMVMGAVRIDPYKVVQISCTET